MKRFPAIFLILLLPFSLFAQKPTQQTDSTLIMIDAFIKQMTLEEKIGQMTQVTLAVIAQNGWGNQDGSIDTAALRKAIQDYKIGSIINTTAHALSAETWRNV